MLLHCQIEFLIYFGDDTLEIDLGLNTSYSK